MLVTSDVSQHPMLPYGFPAMSFEAAKVGQDPSAVSSKQLVTAAFKAAVFAGLK